MEYNFREIEKKWHDYWIAERFIKSKKTRISLNTMYWTCSPILPVRDCTLATRSVI